MCIRDSSQVRSFATEVTALLFGDVLGVTTEDIRNQVIAAVIVVLVTVVMYRPFLALTFNRDKAQTLGMRPKITQAVLLSLLTLSIVTSFQAIGTLLVFGLIVGPPATGTLIARRIPAIMAVAIAVGMLSVVGGLLISFHFGTAGSATIAGLSVLQFFVVLAVKEVSMALRRSVQPAFAT